MKKTIFTALSPNVQSDDIFLAFKTIFTPWKWKRGQALSQLRQVFQSWLPAEHVFLFESGRTSLYAILSALDLQRDDEVLLQAYTCVAVPEPILWVGAKPVYVDAQQDFTMSPVSLEQKISSRCKVLIIQHTFGQPADIQKLLEIAKKHHLFVIEDCAHAFGSLYKGQKVGTFGDASFFSFGRDKVISSVFGGILTVKNSDFAKRVSVFYEKTCQSSSLFWIFQQLLHPILVGFSKATHDYFVGKIFFKMVKALHLLSKEVYQVERHGEKPPFFGHKFPNVLAILALHQFEKLDHYNAHRRMLAEFYTKELAGCEQEKMLVLPKDSKDSCSIYLRYTIQTAKSIELLRSAHKEKIYLGDWYTRALAPEGVDYGKLSYVPADYPVAEKLARETVNLPTHIGISMEDARRVVEVVKSVELRIKN